MHPGGSNLRGTLVNALLGNNLILSQGFSKISPGLCHRLDKQTSGVILVAKTNVM